MPALVRLAGQLPAGLSAAVLVVQHLAATSSGPHLVERLAAVTGLRCSLATTDQPLEAGHLYLAPPDRHLLIRDGHLLVTKGPRENNFRPAVDALFRSAAAHHGTAVVGVVLTGLLHDGTAGLEQIKRAGGQAVVQDPLEAEFPSMPESALSNVEVDYVASLAEMGGLLTRLVSQPPRPVGLIPEDIKLEAAIAERIVGTTEQAAQLGTLAPLTCPGCGGNLWQLNEGNVTRFRCHTGHAYTLGTLLDNSRQGLEETLWVALRMMEERKNLLLNLANRAGSATAGNEFQLERIIELKHHVERLREFLLNGLSSA